MNNKTSWEKLKRIDRQAIPASLLWSFGIFEEDNFVPYYRSGTGMLKW